MRRSALYSALLLVIAGCHKQEAQPPQPAPATAAAVPEEPEAVDTSFAGKPVPKAAFTDLAGTPAKLEDFKGKPVLVNLWATWCVPCIKELPQLDAIAGQGLTVVAISEDLEGARVVTPFLAKKGFKSLKPYLDKSNALLLGLKEAGLPVSVLYGADGKEKWRVRGGMDWTSAKAKALLAQAG
jgi:thiol-disulfide isomerase/thioredoxin